MERILLDTDVVSFYLRGHASVLERVARYLEHHAQLELSVVSYYYQLGFQIAQISGG